jgi:hypothetical protein
MSSTILCEKHEYRLVMLIPGADRILVEEESLPRLLIPKGARPVRALQQLIEDMWSLKSVVLDVLPSRDGLTSSAVVEIRQGGWNIPEGFRDAVLGDLDSALLRDDELSSVQHALSCDIAEGPPFQRFGWVDEAMEWMRTALNPPFPEFNGEIRQSNAGGAFALVRFGTVRGPAYWLKATGSPNESEFALTTWLADRYPQFLPPVRAKRSDWNAWVMEEVGTSLTDSTTINQIARVGATLAAFQKKSETGVDEFVRVGCSDQRTDTLRDHIPEVFHYLADVLETQPGDHQPALTLKRLEEIKGSVRSACAMMQQIGVPDAINNNDMKLGNILCDDTRCVFTDWCHSYVGNPFLTFQHLHTYLERTNAPLAERFKSTYARQWSSRLDSHQIGLAFTLAPLLATFAYLCGDGRWLNSSIQHEAGSQNHSLILLKHLNRAASDPQLLEVLCN